MTLHDVELDAERHGFHLRRIDGAHESLWQWRRGRDRRWPTFPTELEAYGWMEDRLHRRTPFERQTFAFEYATVEQ